MHRGAWVVIDADGGLVDHAGEPGQEVFARSSVKSIQALAMIELGTVERFGVPESALALAASSHAGEPEHVDGVRDLLARIGVEDTVLRCGQREPGHSGGPVAHECSGKHAGFLALARHLGQDPATYLDPDGPAQQEVARRVRSITGGGVVPPGAIDGCSAPTFRMPLIGLARGVASVVTGAGLTPALQTAGRRVVAAVAAHPRLVAGAGRFDTAVSEATGGRVFAKTGAEGVQVAVDALSGRALAVKIDDGSPRAVPALTLHLAERFGLLTAEEAAATGPWAELTVPNAAGLPATTFDLG